jgi:hypothetical protein
MLMFFSVHAACAHGQSLGLFGGGGRVIWRGDYVAPGGPILTPIGAAINFPLPSKLGIRFESALANEGVDLSAPVGLLRRHTELHVRQVASGAFLRYHTSPSRSSFFAELGGVWLATGKCRVAFVSSFVQQDTDSSVACGDWRPTAGADAGVIKPTRSSGVLAAGIGFYWRWLGARMQVDPLPHTVATTPGGKIRARRLTFTLEVTLIDERQYAGR